MMGDGVGVVLQQRPIPDAGAKMPGLLYHQVAQHQQAQTDGDGIGLAILWLSRRRQPAAGQIQQPAPLLSVATLSYDQPRPWVRFWARLLDIADFSLFVALGLHVAKPLVALPGVAERSAITGLMLLLAWVLFEAMLLVTWGTTPGKWLLRIKIERRDGATVDFSDALRRSFAVWLRGLGCGLPLISLFTMVIAWDRLRENGQTSWDRDGGFPRYRHLG